MNDLGNTYLKLKSKKMNVAYIGGSVTEGYGASEPRKKCWPTLVSEWLEKTYGAEIVSLNVAIGGTGSYLADFRFDSEVAPAKPDLLFIEFAVNDKYEGYPYEAVARQIETLIGKAYICNPYMDIVFVLTYDLHDETYDYVQLRAHRDIADKYGLLSIKMSEYLYAHCRKTGEDPKTHYIDWVHPNDHGYEVYAQIIERVLRNRLEDPSADVVKPIARALKTDGNGLLPNAHIVQTSDAGLSAVSGWEYRKEGFTYLGMRYNGHLVADQPESTFTLTFSGTDLGIFYGADNNRGKVSVVIDGRERVIVDGYRWQINPKEYPIISHLKNGVHTATFTLLPERNEKSSGNLFEIGAFLVN